MSSIANVLAHYGCNDAEFADFISELLQNDPEMRPTAEQALNHPWLLGGSGACAPYVLSDHLGEAAKQMRSKYPSMREEEGDAMNDAMNDTSAAPTQLGRRSWADPQFSGQEEDTLGPATPTTFREQCYLDRERGEKKKVDKKWSRVIGKCFSGSKGECWPMGGSLALRPGRVGC